MNGNILNLSYDHLKQIGNEKICLWCDELQELTADDSTVGMTGMDLEKAYKTLLYNNTNVLSDEDKRALCATRATLGILIEYYRTSFDETIIEEILKNE